MLLKDKPQKKQFRIALIGYGALANYVNELIAREADMYIGAILTKSTPLVHNSERSVFVTQDVLQLMSWNPDIVLECAGQNAAKTHVPQLLRSGFDVILASVGIFADPDASHLFKTASIEGGGRLYVPSGAVGGLDALAAASIQGLHYVRYIGTKHPNAWIGSAAEKEYDLKRLETAQVIFEGNAAQAGIKFPRNANVTAAIALAGIGFEETHVRLIADPMNRNNRHEIKAAGTFGELSISLMNLPFEDNPRTSKLAAASVARNLLEWAKT